MADIKVTQKPIVDSVGMDDQILVVVDDNGVPSLRRAAARDLDVVEVDETLTLSHKAADAKTVGDEITNLKDDLNSLANGYDVIIFTIVPNEYVNTGNSGAFEPYNGWSRTDYISVTPGEKLYISSPVKNNWNAFYDENKAYLGSFSVNAGEFVEVEIRSNAHYMALSAANSNFYTVISRRITASSFESVSYSFEQTLTEEQKQIARINIDAVKLASDLTEEGKAAEAKTVGDKFNEMLSQSYNKTAKIVPYNEKQMHIYIPVKSGQTAADVEFLFPKDWGISFSDSISPLYFNSDVTSVVMNGSFSSVRAWTLFIDISNKEFILKPYFQKRNIKNLGENVFELFSFCIALASKKTIYTNQYSEFISNSVLINSLDEFDNRITAIEEGGRSDTAIQALNIDSASKIINSNRKFNKWSDKDSIQNVLTMSVFTDIHGYNDNFLRYLSFCQTYSSYITEKICLGDMVTNWYGDDISYWNDNPDGDDILRTIGNHDVWVRNSSPTVNANQADVYQTYFKGRMSNWNVIRPENADSNNIMYYYKDYNDSNIRLIVLDCMYWDTNEDQWFINALSDALTNDLSVVCVTHYNPVKTNMTGLGNFYSLDYGFSNLVIGIGGSQALADVETFISDGGKFIAWMSGDSHYDACGYHTGTNNIKQISLVFENAGLNSLWNDDSRVEGTKTQDSFNIVSFDTYSKLIKIVRIGSDVDRYLRKKNFVVINYETCTVVTEG